MSHSFRWIALALALAPAVTFAAEPAVGPAAPASDAAELIPVIPEPAAAAPAAAGTTEAAEIPQTPGASGSAIAAPGTPPGAPAPQLSGSWQATEVIVFDRTAVGLAPKGEQLLSEAPRRFPAAITSFDPPGAGGMALYPDDPEARACLWAPAGALPPGTTAFGAAPEAFRAPEPAAAVAQPEPASPPEPAGEAPAAAPLPPPDPLAELQRALQEYEAALAEQSLNWLPANANRLGSGARRLVEQGGFRILFHRTWIQNLAAREPAPLILVQSERDAAALALLEGTVQLRRGRGLQFTAELWYRAPDGAPGTGSPEAVGPGSGSPADSETVVGPLGLPHIRLSDSRRLADGQVYYVDHPKLGVIVRTTAVGIPDEILQAWTALSAPVE